MSIPLKRIPSKVRLRHGFYHLALGLTLSLSALFIPDARPWMFLLFLPFFFLTNRVIDPGLKRRVAAIKAAQDECPDV